MEFVWEKSREAGVKGQQSPLFAHEQASILQEVPFRGRGSGACRVGLRTMAVIMRGRPRRRRDLENETLITH